MPPTLAVASHDYPPRSLRASRWQSNVIDSCHATIANDRLRDCFCDAGASALSAFAVHRECASGHLDHRNRVTAIVLCAAIMKHAFRQSARHAKSPSFIYQHLSAARHRHGHFISMYALLINYFIDIPEQLCAYEMREARIRWRFAPRGFLPGLR